MRGQRYHGVRIAFLPASAAVVTAWWLWRRPFRVGVEGSSMAPVLNPGEFLFALTNARLRRGSLVVVGHPDRPGYEMVKRLAGLPGDVIGGRVLGPGDYWVEGDNPERSTDSRQFGPIEHEAIRGVARFRYWPPSRVGLL